MTNAQKKAASKVVDSKEVPKMEQPSAADTESMDFNALFKLTGFQVPSWKRTLASLVVSFCIGYLGAAVTSYIVSVLMVSTILVTGSAFLTYCVAIVAWLAGLYLTIKAGQKVGMYIATGDIDADLAKVKAKVTGWFKSKPAAPLQAA